MTVSAITSWTKPKRIKNKVKVRTMNWAIKFPAGSDDSPSGYAGPLWITRPTNRTPKETKTLRVTSVYPVVQATKVERPHFQWTVEMSAPATESPPWITLIPSGYLMTLKGGLRVLEDLMKTNALSFRFNGGSTSMSKTGPDHVSYRLYNPKTGEEIISDILQK